MLDPVKEHRERLIAEYRVVGGAIFQKQSELNQLQARSQTLQTAIGALNDTIALAEEGLAAAEAVANITKP